MLLHVNIVRLKYKIRLNENPLKIRDLYHQCGEFRQHLFFSIDFYDTSAS